MSPTTLTLEYNGLKALFSIDDTIPDGCYSFDDMIDRGEAPFNFGFLELNGFFYPEQEVAKFVNTDTYNRLARLALTKENMGLRMTVLLAP